MSIMSWSCCDLDPGHFTQTCWYLGSCSWPASHVEALPTPDIELHLLHLLDLDHAVPGLLLHLLALLEGVEARVCLGLHDVPQERGVGLDILHHRVGGQAGEQPTVRLELHQGPEMIYHKGFNANYLKCSRLYL